MENKEKIRYIVNDNLQSKTIIKQENYRTIPELWCALDDAITKTLKTRPACNGLLTKYINNEFAGSIVIYNPTALYRGSYFKKYLIYHCSGGEIAESWEVLNKKIHRATYINKLMKSRDKLIIEWQDIIGRVRGSITISNLKELENGK